MSQHARLAETIRSACPDQKSPVLSFLSLGGGNSGYQFSSYGYVLTGYHTYSQTLLSQKQYAAVKSHATSGSIILSCTAESEKNVYFVTSLVPQKEMKIQAIFHTPGENFGYLVSLSSFLIYLTLLFRLFIFKHTHHSTTGILQ